MKTRDIKWSLCESVSLDRKCCKMGQIPRRNRRKGWSTHKLTGFVSIEEQGKCTKKTIHSLCIEDVPQSLSIILEMKQQFWRIQCSNCSISTYKTFFAFDSLHNRPNPAPTVFPQLRAWEGIHSLIRIRFFSITLMIYSCLDFLLKRPKSL